MAQIVPFCGVRYNPQNVGDVGQVIAPPYDVIKTDERMTLENRHPNNIVRLILSPPDDNDTETDNQYTRAAGRLRDWISTEVLAQDTSPCYYAYDQTFTTPDGRTYTRRALVGAGKLEPFGTGVVFPHEKTLAAPKADRLNLMRQCHANLSPIFLLYSDPEGEIENAMARFIAANAPVVDVSERFGTTHQLWRIDDVQINQEIQSLFSSKSLVIADGHHRYETALAFRDEIRAQSLQWTGEEGYNYVMMNLVRMESPGLAVLAIHRLLSGLSSNQISQAIDQLPKSFDVTATNNLTQLLENLHALSGKRPAFGMYIGGDAYHLLVPQIDEDAEISVYDRLDVTLLHTRVIEQLFGIDITIPEHQKQISYTVKTDEAVQYVKDSGGRVALFMNPTPVSQASAIAMGSQTMPQKSTYFYPKMATGLVLNLLKD
ncbi:DUF1015 domain-containing protein [Candidatus Poribacteria bacterium]|nr:DUF1015 domain-containing protein [Candidatus Poribacteria bacterium]